ncbi:MAG: hypothetical protein O7B35_09425 [Deltaproteobacteria bacterium]|nr:hypothetical protein [Deltaproteobacteria bacterium]
MRILFDQGTPVPLRKLLNSHQVETAFERGWSTLTNGELLAAAEREGFEVFVTTDRNLSDQQNLGGLRIAIIVLSSTSWTRIEKAATAIKQALDATSPGSFKEVSIP